MDVEEDHENGVDEILDFSFLPKSLVVQCESLIESFHDLHGYSCLPDALWKAGLGPFIETHEQLRRLLRKASMARSAKKSSAGFARIATTILSLEILASRFAGWSSIYPQQATKSRDILKAIGRSLHHPLIEFYLYPPKYPNSTVLAALSSPPNLYDANLCDVSADETVRDPAAIDDHAAT